MKKFAAAAVLAFGLSMSMTSCLGHKQSFNAFNNLASWNRTVTDNKWLNELIFLGLNIIPVYGLFQWGDVLIFNSMEFWTGNNPIEAKKM